MIDAGISSWWELVDEVEDVNEDGDDVESVLEDVAEYWNSWNERLWSVSVQFKQYKHMQLNRMRKQQF